MIAVRICIAAPFACADLAPLLSGGILPADAPAGYPGAPLTAVLAAELVRLGHEVQALTVDYQWRGLAFDWSARGPGFTLRVLAGRRHAWRPDLGRCGRAWDQFRMERQALEAAMRAWAPDVVHAHWTYEFALAALASGRPTLVTAHDSPRQILRMSRSPYRALRGWMARKVFRQATAMTTVSPYMADELHAQGAGEVAVVPNPVARHVLARARARPRPVIPSVGLVSNGWLHRKNVAVALQGFAEFRRAHPGVELHLYGSELESDGPAQRWARSAGVDGGSVFHGPLPHERLARCLAEHDVLLHPALEESFGVVLVEAMAMGLPVVAGRASGAVPWVAGEPPGGRAGPAVLADVGSPAAIAQALAQVVDADYEGRSAAAIENVRRRFEPSAVAAAYLQHYLKVLAGAHAAPAEVRPGQVFGGGGG